MIPATDGSAAGATVTFAAPAEHVDVAVVVVTYQSERHLGRLIASTRQAARDARVRMVVVDNASSDGSLQVARAERDVVVVESGGNLGYAAAINVALRHVDPCDAVLVLNPDLSVEPGCLTALLARLRSTGAGAVVPRFVTDDGDVRTSLRREPSLTRAVGDALLGSHLTRRPAWAGEMVLTPETYDAPTRVEWATGAALLVTRDASLAVGDWDEQFFLYSEETDFFRRLRDLGYDAWYEPDAVVAHEEGGSGSSVALQRLMAVNRVRYYRKFHGPLASLAFHGAVALHEAIRAGSAEHRAVLRTVVSPRSWSTLPQAERTTPHTRADVPPVAPLAPGSTSG